jgi:hypothetical protein
MFHYVSLLPCTKFRCYPAPIQRFIFQFVCFHISFCLPMQSAYFYVSFPITNTNNPLHPVRLACPYLCLPISNTRVSRLHHATSREQMKGDHSKAPWEGPYYCVKSPINHLVITLVALGSQRAMRSSGEMTLHILLMRFHPNIVPFVWTSFLIELWRCIMFIDWLTRSIHYLYWIW